MFCLIFSIKNMEYIFLAIHQWCHYPEFDKSPTIIWITCTVETPVCSHWPHAKRGTRLLCTSFQTLLQHTPSSLIPLACHTARVTALVACVTQTKTELCDMDYTRPIYSLQCINMLPLVYLNVVWVLIWI